MLFTNNSVGIIIFLEIINYIYIILYTVVCNALYDPTNNGGVTTNGTEVGHTASYFCENGYVLIGNDTVTCQSNGTWSEPPICEG